jgi:hypothetical protein
MFRILPALGMAFFCLPLMADEVDLGFNSDALRAIYLHEFRSNALELDGGWLHHSDNGNVLHVGLNLSDIASGGSKDLVAGLGGRIAWHNGDKSKQDGFSVPVGGFLFYTPPRINRLTFGAALYFAPSVLSIGDADKYQDFMVRAAYNVLRQADIYIGARYVKGEYDNAPDAYYDTGMHIGLTLRF